MFEIILYKCVIGSLRIGDPDDRSLRKVETEIMIPKIMREKAKTEKCTRQVEGEGLFPSLYLLN